MNANTQYILWGWFASVALVVSAIAVLARVVYRTLRKAEEISDQVLGDPREGVPSLREFRVFVTTELSYNSGKSLKDQVRQISEKVGSAE